MGRALGARVPPCGWETHLHMIPPHVSSVCAAPRSASPVFLRQIRRQLWQQCGGDFWSSPAGGLSAVRGDFLRRLAHTHPRPSPLLRMPLGAQTAHNNIGRGTGISCGLKRGAALPCRAPDIAAWIQSRTLYRCTRRCCSKAIVPHSTSQCNTIFAHTIIAIPIESNCTKYLFCAIQEQQIV